MSVTKERKQEIFKTYGGAETNTGSTEAQIALLTERIAELSNHLQSNKKDNHNRLILLKYVGRRRGLLNYLKRTNLTGYRELVEKLGLRK